MPLGNMMTCQKNVFRWIFSHEFLLELLIDHKISPSQEKVKTMFPLKYITLLAAAKNTTVHMVQNVQARLHIAS